MVTFIIPVVLSEKKACNILQQLRSYRLFQSFNKYERQFSPEVQFRSTMISGIPAVSE